MDTFAKRAFALLAGLSFVIASAAAQVETKGPAQAQPRNPVFEAALAEQRPGPAVSRIGALSDYVPSLFGTALDSPVYFIEPEAPLPSCPSILILGGTHGNELAGVVAASLFVSWARPLSARLIVIPRANASAATWPDPDRPGPVFVAIPGASGERRFRYGSRLTDPKAEILPDPPAFFPQGADQGGKGLAGQESRNLNRNYPGDPLGSLTSRAAAAIFAIIGAENVRAAFDFHEAGPSSGLAWDIVAHPKNIAYAAMGILAAEDRGVSMVLDQSREEHRGLSHREWGEGTQAAAYLIETLNMGQVAGGNPGFNHLGDSKAPLWKRVGIQIEIVLAILQAQSETDADAAWATIEGLPGIEALQHDFSKYF
ncbi:MAG TPA: succinylglutamate desuccinylase/aspartoacylase family protein [Rectinemataceae bacterium]|nr:succinylglutamate desuccinylase/aspartoacylase family protein [Rectinemataceae bacterium]